jgi:hypothetical protein
VKNRLPPPTFLKQLEEALQELWCKIPLDTVHNLYESIPSRTAAALSENIVEYHINKEMCTVFIVFPLFCPTPVNVI